MDFLAIYVSILSIELLILKINKVLKYIFIIKKTKNKQTNAQA